MTWTSAIDWRWKESIRILYYWTSGVLYQNDTFGVRRFMTLHGEALGMVHDVFFYMF